MFLKRELKWKQTWKIYLNFDWAKYVYHFYLYVCLLKTVRTLHFWTSSIEDLKAKGELII